MPRWYRLSMMALILLVAWGCAQTQPMAEVKPMQIRFTKANNGVITDSVTGLDWYIGSTQNWRQAKAWTENLTVGGGGWRLPTVPELKALYQKDASPNNMDPIFQTDGVWVWSGELRNAWSAWGFAFYNGLEGWHSMDYGNGRLAFAVRSRR